MTRVYYKEALGAFVVYDVTRPQTFEGVRKWKADLDSKISLPEAWGGGNIPVVLLANKVCTSYMICSITSYLYILIYHCVMLSLE